MALSKRLMVPLSPAQKEALAEAAKKDGESLAPWVRKAALEKAGKESLLHQRNVRTFFAFEFAGSESTTTGEPNPRTGKLSIAGNLRGFTQKSERTKWIEEGPIGKPGYVSGVRRAVSRVEARELCAGMSQIEFDEYSRSVID